jgi:riboflavin kinase/FMN adenylyltransferase
MTSLRVCRRAGEAAAVFAPSALTIGNFDGVHLGHQELIRRLRGAAGVPSVLTFDPHPTSVVAPARAPRLLSTIAERLAWMEELGVEQALVEPFDHAFASLDPGQFVERIVAGAARARLVVVGENFRFGARQAGDTAMLAELGRRHGFDVQVAPPVSYRGQMVSSTLVRARIESGAVARAARLLGRPYAIGGPIVTGHGVGSRQTVPTLNLATTAQVIPARGVYVTQVEIDGAWREAVTNIGFRPTFGGDAALSIESFALDGVAATPAAIRVRFLWRLRAERKFDDAAALRAQILKDVVRARAYFRRRSGTTS